MAKMGIFKIMEVQEDSMEMQEESVCVYSFSMGSMVL